MYIRSGSARVLNKMANHRWIATVHGPVETPYVGLVYKLVVEFPLNYPHAAPLVRFETPCYHPNVDLKTGAICLDILKEKWSPIYNVSTVLLSLQSLLGEPNNDSPLNPEAAQVWADRVAFRKKVVDSHPDDPKC
ncbi:hypothetical protein HDV03_005284 [Kappamyces sp. JEL0829]|nr:hypothetical protein HDV03_005284 [Kappamyces sp. JEL0829]